MLSYFTGRKGHFAVNGTVAALALAALIWAGLVVLPKSEAMAQQTIDPPTRLELTSVLSRTGLRAEPLAAAGVTDQETSTLVANLRDHVEENIQAIRDADAAVRQNQRDYDRLQRIVQAGTATQQELQGFADAGTALTEATAARQALLDGAFTAATDGLAANKIAAIERIQGNSAKWQLPTPYLAGPSETMDWAGIREALANQRISARLGEQMDYSAEQTLQAADNHADVAAARTNLSNNLAAIESAWNQALQD